MIGRELTHSKRCSFCLPILLILKPRYCSRKSQSDELIELDYMPSIFDRQEELSYCVLCLGELLLASSPPSVDFIFCVIVG